MSKDHLQLRFDFDSASIRLRRKMNMFIEHDRTECFFHSCPSRSLKQEQEVLPAAKQEWQPVVLLVDVMRVSSCHTCYYVVVTAAAAVETSPYPYLSWFVQKLFIFATYIVKEKCPLGCTSQHVPSITYCDEFHDAIDRPTVAEPQL